MEESFSKNEISANVNSEQSENIPHLYQKISKEINEVEIKPEDRNGQGQLLVSPGGNRSYLSEYNWKLVRTPAFKKWFSDSCVVDQNNEPLVVYHTMRENFEGEKFKLIKPSESTKDMPWRELGIFFTSEAHVAHYFQQNRYGSHEKDKEIRFPVFIKIKNPLTFETMSDLAYSFHKIGGETKESVKAKGYDGLIQKRGDLMLDHPYVSEAGIAGDQFAVFDPDNILIIPSDIDDEKKKNKKIHDDIERLKEEYSLL